MPRSWHSLVEANTTFHITFSVLVNIHTHTNTHAHTRTYTHTHIHIHIHIQSRAHAHTHAHTHPIPLESNLGAVNVSFPALEEANTNFSHHPSLCFSIHTYTPRHYIHTHTHILFNR